LNSCKAEQNINVILPQSFRLLYNQVIKRLRHEPNQIDIIWLGELVKRQVKSL